MENLFWHYVKGQTKMFTNKTFAAETIHNLNRNRLESLMAKIGWNEDTTFPELVKQSSLLNSEPFPAKIIQSLHLWRLFNISKLF